MKSRQERGGRGRERGGGRERGERRNQGLNVVWSETPTKRPRPSMA